MDLSFSHHFSSYCKLSSDVARPGGDKVRASFSFLICSELVWTPGIAQLTLLECWSRVHTSVGCILIYREGSCSSLLVLVEVGCVPDSSLLAEVCVRVEVLATYSTGLDFRDLKRS